MKETLSLYELKAMCKVCYDIGLVKGTQRGVSPGRLQDRGEEIAPTFEELWERADGGKLDQLIKNESILMHLQECQKEIDAHMEQFDREQKIKVAEAIEVLRKFVITA